MGSEITPSLIVDKAVTQSTEIYNSVWENTKPDRVWLLLWQVNFFVSQICPLPQIADIWNESNLKMRKNLVISFQNVIESVYSFLVKFQGTSGIVWSWFHLVMLQRQSVWWGVVKTTAGELLRGRNFISRLEKISEWKINKSIKHIAVFSTQEVVGEFILPAS